MATGLSGELSGGFKVDHQSPNTSQPKSKEFMYGDGGSGIPAVFHFVALKVSSGMQNGAWKHLLLKTNYVILE